MRRVWRLTSARTRTRRSRTGCIMVSKLSRRAMCIHVKREHCHVDLSRGKVRVRCGNRAKCWIEKIVCSISAVFSGLGTRAPGGRAEIDNFEASRAYRRRPCRLADRRKCVVHLTTATASCKIICSVVVPEENRSGARERRPGADMWRQKWPKVQKNVLFAFLTSDDASSGWEPVRRHSP